MLFILITDFFGTTLNVAPKVGASLPSPLSGPCRLMWDLLEAEGKNYPEVNGCI